MQRFQAPSLVVFTVHLECHARSELTQPLKQLNIAHNVFLRPEVVDAAGMQGCKSVQLNLAQTCLPLELL